MHNNEAYHAFQLQLPCELVQAPLGVLVQSAVPSMAWQRGIRRMVSFFVGMNESKACLTMLMLLEADDNTRKLRKLQINEQNFLRSTQSICEGEDEGRQASLVAQFSLAPPSSGSQRESERISRHVT